MTENRDRYTGKKAADKYPFTSKIICGICGKHYKRKIRKGRVSCNCSTYLKYGKDSCNAKQIPESILHSLTTDVLGITEFDEMFFEQQIKEIRVPQAKLLIFVFYDGRTIRKEWNYKSRSESWSEEDRQRAREKQLKYLERRDAQCMQQEQ
jgi:site-specific DNA recombinase